MPLLRELLDRTTLPGIFKGIKVTLTHLFTPRNKKLMPTAQYPEEKMPEYKNTRGIHYMKVEDGRANCVACFMCSTACPSNAITIVQKAAPEDWEDRDTYPETYVIDELRCIFCGMCEEACPKDAIHLSSTHAPTFHSRQEAVYDLDLLMKNHRDIEKVGRVQFD